MAINVHTYYSLKYGVLDIQQTILTMKNGGYKRFAITDVNNTSACLDFLRMAPEYDIEPVVGIDFRNGVDQKYVGIAQTNTGFEGLNRFLSEHLHEKQDFPDQMPQIPETIVVYPFSDYRGEYLAPNAFIGVKPADLNRLRFAKYLPPKDKLVAMPTATFLNKRQFNAHRLLRAIDNNMLLSRLSISQQAPETDLFYARNQLDVLYGDYPFLLQNMDEILKNCDVHFRFKDPSHHENKRNYMGSVQADIQKLRSLCQEGLPYRYPSPSQTVLKRIETEIEIIAQKGFTGYFLMNWDIVNYARHKNYYYVGRGSGANSIVAYLLKITDVDPIELDLYFERFINLYRQNPPDFDIDFSWRDREDVTQYIFKRFSTAALLGTYNTLKLKAVVRELGKVFGLPPREIDQISGGDYKSSRLDHIAKLVLKYGKLIHRFPSHLSVHASGIVVPEKHINHFCGTFLPPKGFATTQISMIEAEDVGLYKFDVLSQRGLSKIKDTLDIIAYNQPDNPPEDIHNIGKFKTDVKTNDLLKEGKAIGCFYVESPAMRMLLSKLEVDDYLGLVAASSIIRPGVAKSGMMREYILRHKDRARRKLSHPILADIMPDTYGIMVYQEDVIKVAHYFAGLTLGEADELRRGMSGKYRSREEFMKVKDKFFNNCQDKGYSSQLTQEVWDQIESFAGYAFSKGHSASYAVESYQCLYLKAYYPLEYMVATINNHGGFYRTEVYVHEARMHGATICPPCINVSSSESIIKDKVIYLGLSTIGSLESNTIKRIVEEKNKRGLFESFEDFVDRVSIGLEQLILLIRIGAFDFTKTHKRKLLWKAHYSVSKRKTINTTNTLFRQGVKKVSVPELDVRPFEDTFDQMELLGYPLSDPFKLASNQEYERVFSRDLKRLVGTEIKMRGYLVSIKNTSTSGGYSMNFGTFLDEEGSFFDTTHFPKIAAEFPFRGKGIYTVTGQVVEEFDFYSIEVTGMQKEKIIEDE